MNLENNYPHGEVTASSTNTVWIPQNVMDALDVEIGDKLYWFVKDFGMLVVSDGDYGPQHGKGTIHTNGNTTIPSYVRMNTDVREGDTLEWYVRGSGEGAVLRQKNE